MKEQNSGAFDATLAAYKELWAAVENGTVSQDFFTLRERFRAVVG